MSRIRLARYAISEKSREEAERAIREFVAAIRENEPATEYRAYREAGSNQYLHVMVFPDQASEQKHRESPWTEKFVETLYPLCEIEPVFTDVERIEIPDEK